MHIRPKRLILKQYWPLLYERYRFKICYSGRGSGKSVNIVRTLLFLMLQFRDFKVLCLREVQDSIEASSKAEIELQIEELGLSNYFKITDKYIKCPLTGGVFLFKGMLRHLTSIKSIPKVNVAWIEEAEGVSNESLNTLIPTIREQGAEVWMSFNPNTPIEAVSQMFIECDELPPDTLIINSNYDENEYLSETMAKQIEHMKVTNYKRYLHIYRGQYADISEDSLFSLEVIKRAINRDYDYSNDIIKAGLDVAREGSDHAVLTITQGNRIIDIFDWPHTKDSVLLANQVIVKLIENNVNVVGVDTVGIGGPVADILRSKIGNTIEVVDFDCRHKSDNKGYSTLKDEAIGKVLDWLTNGGSIPNNKELIEDLQATRYYFDNKENMCIVSKKQLKKSGHRSTDWLDSLAIALFVTRKKVTFNMPERSW